MKIIRRILLTVFILGFVAGLFASHAHAFTMADGNVQALNCNPHGHSAVRIILPEYFPVDYYLPCANNAVRHGHKLILVDQYRNCAPLRTDRARLRRMIRSYPHAWAIAIGNEQDLSAQGDIGCQPGANTTAAYYVRVWRNLIPILLKRSPHTLRVAGEVSPWGIDFTTSILKDGLPHVQVISGHPYPQAVVYTPHKFVGLAHHYHIQAWADEGMCGTGAWAYYGCTTPHTLCKEGYTLGGEWYTPTPTTTTTI
jgi:hypothetical protein